MQDYSMKPAFHSWQHENLVGLVNDLWTQNKQLRDAIEQLRMDNKDLSKELRDLLRKDVDDWK